MKILKNSILLLLIFPVNIFAQITLSPQWLIPNGGEPVFISSDRSKSFVRTDYGIGVCEGIGSIPFVLYTGIKTEEFIISNDGKYAVQSVVNKKSYHPDSLFGIIVWDVESNKRLYTWWGKYFEYHRFFVSSNNKNLVEIKDTVINVYNLITGELEKNIVRNKEEFKTAGFSPESKFFFIIEGPMLRVWDAGTWDLYTDLEKRQVSKVEFSADSKKMSVISSGSNTVEIVDMETLNFMALYNSKRGSLTSAILSNDGTKTAIIEAKGSTLIVWDIEKDTILQELELSDANNYLQDVYFLSDLSKNVVVRDARTTSIWDYSKIKQVRYLDDVRVYKRQNGFEETVTFTKGHYIYTLKDSLNGLVIDSTVYWRDGYLTFDKTGEYLLSSSEGLIQKLDMEKRTIVSTHTLASAERTSDIGKYMVFENKQFGSTVEIWDKSEQKKIYTIKKSVQNSEVYDLSDDAKKIIFRYGGNGVYSYDIYDLVEGKRIITLKEAMFGMKNIQEVRFAPTGEKLYVVLRDDYEYLLYVVGLSSANDITFLYSGGDFRVRELLNQSNFSISFDKEGKNIALFADRKVRVFDIEAKTEKFTLKSENEPESFSTRIKYSNGPFYVATYSNDTNVYIWDAESGKLMYSLPHQSVALDICFSKNDEQLLTACTDGTAYVWDIEGQKLLKKLTSPNDSLTSVVYNNDETKVLGANWYWQRMVWDISQTSDITANEKYGTQTLHSLYPNPTDDIITIDLNLQDITKQAKYYIQDLFGNKVISGVLPQGTTRYAVLVDKLISGKYIFNIEVNTKNESKIFTVIK